MFSSNKTPARSAGLLIAGLLSLASFLPVAHAQAGSNPRADATNVQMVAMSETYCRTIDNTDMTGVDFYTSAADVTAKSGKVIQSHNGGSCCTAAAPWNGTACQAVPVCSNDTDLVGWSCVATANSCARVGLSLINGACGVAAPPAPPSANASQYIGRMLRVRVKMSASATGTNEHIEIYINGNKTLFGPTLYYFLDEFQSVSSESYKLFPVNNTTGSTVSGAISKANWPTIKAFFQNNYGSDVRFVLDADGVTITGSKKANLLPWSWTHVSVKNEIPY